MTGESRGTLGTSAQQTESQESDVSVPLAALHEAILVSDQGGRVSALTAEAQNLLGVPRESVIGRHVDDVLRLSERSQAPTVSPSAQRSGVCAASLATPSGTRRYIEYTCSTLSASGEHVYVFRDVTQRRKLSEQEMLLDRLNSLSSLVDGVAHEMNNPLAFSLGSLELARRTLRSLREGSSASSREALIDRLEKAIETSAQGASRVAEIVNDLRTFARTSQDAPTLVDIHQSIDAAIRLSMHEIRQRARIVKETHAHPMIFASERRLSQLFVNLLIYAAQSMEPGSSDNTIRVAVDATESGEAVIEISDNGQSIDPALLPHVFNPLFSPRPGTQGSSLRLSVCHEIVAELGGRISAHSDPQGTSFRIVLKGRRSAVDAARGATAKAIPAQRERRVLLVDDEPALVSVFAELLTEEGYKVVTANDGAEALNLLRSDRAFDAILCDVMMPLMDGIGLFERARELSPELSERFVFMTGGATTDRAAQFLSQTRQPWIPKPIDMRRLVEALGQLSSLEGPAQRPEASPSNHTR